MRFKAAVQPSLVFGGVVHGVVNSREALMAVIIIAQPFSSLVLLPVHCCPSLVDICFPVLLGCIYESDVFRRSPGDKYAIKKAVVIIRTRLIGDQRHCGTRASATQDVKYLKCLEAIQSNSQQA